MTITPATLAQTIRAAGINPVELADEWDVTPRVAEQWQTSKQPPFKAEDYAAKHLEQMAGHVNQLLDVIQAAGDSTVLLRSYWPDDLVTGSSGTPLHGHQYNLTIQHLLLLEELGAFEATIVVVPTNRWFDNDTRHLVLSPRTPVFAVAHRLPDQARIDLCVPATDSDDPGVESAEDLIAVDTLHVDLPLPQEQVSASGLWKQGAYKPILLAEGFRPTTDWRLSGTGYPIAIASVLPIDVTPHLHSHP